MLPTKMTEHDDVQTVLKDTIVLLCRNALQFQSQVNVEALVAITVDQNKVLLVSIRETLHADNTDAQCSCLVSTDQDKSPTDSDVVDSKIIVNTSACDPMVTDQTTSKLQEARDNSKSLDGSVCQLVDTNQDSLMLIKSDSGSNPGSTLVEDCASYDPLSFSHNPSEEALDLTGCARKLANTATKRKHRTSDYILTSKEVRLNEPEATADDVDNCSQSSSVVCIKDEIPAAAVDDDAEWSSVLSTSVPPQGNCLNWHHNQRASCSLANVNNSNSLTEEGNTAALSPSDQAMLDTDVMSVCQSIIGYSGWCVPLRDIQRLRLRGLPSAVIRTAMETLERTGLGRCCEVTGNMCVFYKCPPHLVTADALSRWHLTWSDYSLQFASLPAVNQTNRHNESYWQRVASSCPYNFALDASLL